MPKKPAKLVDEMLSPSEIEELRRVQKEQSEYGKKAFAHHQAAKLRPDVAEVAFRVFQEAIGEKPKTLPPNERAKADRNPDAVKRGAKGGRTGGKVRAAKQSKAARTTIAKKAAAKRWSKTRDS